MAIQDFDFKQKTNAQLQNHAGYLIIQINHSLRRIREYTESNQPRPSMIPSWRLIEDLRIQMEEFEELKTEAEYRGMTI